MTKHSSTPEQHCQVTITADMSALSVDDKRVMALLVEAAKEVDNIYLIQSQQSGKAETVPFDTEVHKNFYPEGTTAADILAFLDEYPDSREALLNPCTVVTGEKGSYEAVPYSEYYRESMRVVADLLSQAATLSKDGPFKTFLEKRSEAFKTNQYRESDIAWIYANNGPFEITIGPYESYADKLFGVKRTFEAIVGVVLEKETAVSDTFQDYVSRFDAYLGKRYSYATKTRLTPMVVMDEIYGSGEAVYEYVPMAYNLPNDRDIHAEVGSKKVFLRNVMAAKFEYLTRAIAREVLTDEDMYRFDFDTYLRFVIGHESAHGLSFHFEGAVFGPVASGMEEGKADLFGMWFLYYLVDQGMLEASVAESAVIQNLTDGLRQIRFGAEEAHAVGTIIQLNWFIKRKALVVTESGFGFNPEQFRSTITSLGDEFYDLAHAENQDAVKRFVSKWGKEINPHILGYMPRFRDIPIDIDPVFSV